MTLNKAETKVRAILAAAEELFEQHAYADVSMRDIAEAAEVTTGALYHYFPSKEQLYNDMMRAYFSRVRRASLEATPPNGNIRERLRLLTRGFLALPPEQRRLMSLVRRDINVFKGRTRDGLVRAYQASVPDLVEAVVRQGILSGELKPRDVRWLAWAYVAIVETTLAEYAEQRLGDIDVRLEAALDLFLDGAGASHAH